MYTLSSLALVFLALAIWYASMVPPGEGVDEVHHFDYAAFIARHWRLPAQPHDPGPPEAVMVHHPPLYYLLAAPLLSAFDLSDRDQALRFNPHFEWSLSGDDGWRVMLPAEVTGGRGGAVRALYALRLLSVLLGTVALAFIYGAARLLVPAWPWAPLGIGAVACLNPSFLYMAATVHHDILLATVGAAGLYWCLKSLRRPVGPATLLAAGALAVAALLTKLSGLAVLLAILCTLAVRTRRAADWRGRPAQMAAVLAGAALLAGWWYVRNAVLYGDPMGQALFVRNFPHMLRPDPLTWGLLVHEFTVHLQRTYWGAFGFMHIVFPAPVRTAVWIVVVVALLGWAAMAVRALRGMRPSGGSAKAWAILLLFLVLLTAFLARFSAFALGAWQGRYFLAAALTIGALIVAGLNGYAGGRSQRVISLVLFGVMTAYAVAAPLRYVWPKYVLAPAAGVQELAAATRLNVEFDRGIELVAARAVPAILVPGQALDIYTYWRARPDAGAYADVHVDMSVVSPGATLLAASSFWPDVDTLPEIWGDRTVVNKQSFQIADDVAPGAVTVARAVRDGQDGPVLATAANPAAQGPVTILELPALGSVVEVSPSTAPLPPRAELLGDAIQLAAAGLPAQVKAGGLLPVTLYWRVLADVTQDYTVFVHVVDEAGQIVAQLDRPPGGGASPTSTWRAGQFLRDTYPVSLPDGLAPGDYHVRAGLYGWPDLARLPVARDGAPAGDFVDVGAVTVSP